jgi:hypothetical protein
MFYRVAIAALWFVAFLSLHELAWSTFGSPRYLGIVAGAVGAAFFYFDPARLFIVAPPSRPATGISANHATAERAPVTR